MSLVDRIQIESNRIRTRNNVGGVTFDSNDKYLKTTSSGNFKFAGYRRQSRNVPVMNDNTSNYQSTHSVANAVGFDPSGNMKFVSAPSSSGLSTNVYRNFSNAGLGIPNGALTRANFFNYVPAKAVVNDPYRAPAAGRELVLTFPIGMNSYTLRDMNENNGDDYTVMWASTNGSSRHSFTAQSDETSDTLGVYFGLEAYTYMVTSSLNYVMGCHAGYTIESSDLAQVVGSGQTFRVNFPDIRSTSYSWHDQKNGGSINYGVNRRSKILSKVGSQVIPWSSSTPHLVLYGDPVGVDLAVTP